MCFYQFLESEVFRLCDNLSAKEPLIMYKSNCSWPYMAQRLLQEQVVISREVLEQGFIPLYPCSPH